MGAEEILKELDLEMPLLEKEWKEQVAAQTKPLARQSKNIANSAIKEIMALYTARNAFAVDLGGLDQKLIAGDYGDDMSVEDVLAACLAVVKKQTAIEETIKTKKKKLGVREQENLKNLMGNKFLQLKLNARALKQRVRDQLRNRKFELERLERAYRHTTSNGKTSLIKKLLHVTNVCFIRDEIAFTCAETGQSAATNNC